jgi:hypothetical protein
MTAPAFGDGQKHNQRGIWADLGDRTRASTKTQPSAVATSNQRIGQTGKTASGFVERQELIRWR